MPMDIHDKIFYGDSRNILKDFPDSSIDLIVTSPPYADKRKNVYAGIKLEEYVKWFEPIATELYRVLKARGSFVLNIKEGANGERQTYVLELIQSLRKMGWLWIEEYIWRKTTSMPGKWPNRFRDGWERCLHFTKQRKFKMYQKNVMIPVGDWYGKRMNNLSKNDKNRTQSATGSQLGRRLLNWKSRKMVYPDNVLEFAPACKNYSHPAVFPKELPSWFIKLFTKEGDLVLDPFLGSGTTAIASKMLRRRYVGIEKNYDYYLLAKHQIRSIS